MAPAHGIWVPKCEGRLAFTSKKGAIRHEDYHDRPRLGQERFWCDGPGCGSQVASTVTDAGIFREIASLPGRHRSVRHVASLGARADQVRWRGDQLHEVASAMQC